MSRVMRACAVVGVVTTLIALPASPAAAFDTLEDYLAEAESAEYSGRRIVITSWQGDSEIGTFDVTHAGDVTMSNQTQVSSGKVAAENAAVAVLDWSRSALAERYTVVEVGPVERLGRPAHALDVFENGVLRASIVFDDVTGAALLTEMYDGDGERFRFSAMLEFDDRPNLVYSQIGTAGRDYDLMIPVADSTLPSQAAGYTRIDSYSGEDAWLQAFYSDGLFSFSVFEAAGSISLHQFDEAGTFTAGDDDYALLVRPTEVWVTWQADGETYVLVGDLPPDHLEDILEVLPGPDHPGLFKRLWRGLFG